MLVTNKVNVENIKEWILERSYSPGKLRTSIGNSKHIQQIMLEKTSMINCDRFSQRSWHIINNIYDEPKCYCGNKVNFLSTTLGFSKTCSIKCAASSIEVQEKYKKTCMKKYGVDNVYKSKDFKEFMHKNNIKKYGVDEYFKSNEFKEKSKKKILALHGVDHFSKSEKSKNINKERNIKKYGVNAYFSTNEFKEKSKLTMLKLYGVDHPMKSKEIIEKMLKSGHYKKEYVLPSSKIIKVQGYEPKALDILFKTYKEDDILLKLSDMPLIMYKIDNVDRRYYTDIYIPIENRLIEVKSTWTYKIQKEITLLKHEAAKLAGFIHEIWIFGKDFLEIIK